MIMNLPDGYLLQNGKYKLTHVIGQGGFGITYKGIWNTEVKGPLGTIKTEVPVCVKEYFFKDYCFRDADSQAVRVHSETGKILFDKFKEKLIKEAKILSEVHHPYIVNVLEVFEENNTAYIAMEYIAGSSLKSILEQDGVLPESTVLRYVRQIGEALQFVHEKNILHLDIKPSNILIDQHGNARLIDFGVSKRYDMEQEETSTTMLTLSKGFASIEQYDNEGIQMFSPRPDIYSLGATMYNLLTGKIPPESILRATRPLRNPREINPEIREETESVILKAMQIIPADRFATVGEMMAALDFSIADKDPCPLDTSSPTSIPDGDEETKILDSPSAGRMGAVDEDATILKEQPAGEDKPLPERRKASGKVLPIGVALLVIVGSAAAIWIYDYRPKADLAGRMEPVSSGIQDSMTVETGDSVVMDPVVSPEETAKGNGLEAESEPEPKTLEMPRGSNEDVVAERTKPTVREERVAVEEQGTVLSEDRPTEAEVTEKYNRLIASGKSKMAQADYAGARRDFSEARDTRLTEEVVRLMIDCDERAEAKRVADKIAQYEEKMAFGKYKIVRKKSNNRYGAIDSDGEERIPCKYLSVGISDNGRAFEREDNLFDIYNTDGALIGEGRTYY